MGDVKDSMQTTTPKNKGLLDKLLDRKSKRSKDVVQSDDDIANSFVDMVVLADTKLEKLLQSKEKDLANEKGQETKNKRSIRLLEKMQGHLEEIADLVQEYKDQ
jgi:hypothetical protein